MAGNSFAFELLDRWMALPPEDRKELSVIVARELLKNASPASVEEALQILQDDAARRQAVTQAA